MNRASKQILAVGGVVASIIVAVGVPSFRHLRAEERFSQIVEGLRRIDSGTRQLCVEINYSMGARVSRALLEKLGSPPDPPLPYVVWPSAPIPGIYAPTTCDGMATFDGGTNGALNRSEWKSTCSINPSACGL